MKKVVLDLPGGNQKTRQKAMKIAGGFFGVSAVAIEGNDKSKLEVRGEGVDAAKLTLLLRKKLARKCYFLRANNPAGVSLVSVGPVEQKKKDNPAEGPKDKKQKKEETKVPSYYDYPLRMYSVHELREPGCVCSIL